MSPFDRSNIAAVVIIGYPNEIQSAGITKEISIFMNYCNEGKLQELNAPIFFLGSAKGNLQNSETVKFFDAKQTGPE